ncbi:complex I subunit 4 family protein [Prosthecobacter dejongeii]|uniref:NADH-quinone oxidoreductase subunit M n=1 Tax=Prosthecobacter dejongeii TaxID=48465 RepID=A0A7W8DQP3_9BACT|nr:NADH-quinone oxidoreductase subunit M [Prosthecobacter dejongeii]MBB5038121.1 NADH-quinone oxidoreductase subunit M [Prosthecobacter dejongeii]
MSVLEIVILLPIIAALAIWLGAPARATSVGAAILNLLIVLGLLFQFKSASAGGSGMAFESARVVLDNPAITFGVGADGVSLILALLTALVTFAAVWQIAADKPAIYHIASLLIAGGGLGAFLSTDVFFIYAFHELALIPTFLMIGLYGHGEDSHRKAVAWKTTIYLGAGSLVLLAGLAWLVLEYSGGQKLTFDLNALRAQAALTPLPVEKQGLIFFVLLLGFGTLVSLFPLHSWAAPAYATAPTPVAMLHAGVLKKFGLYGLIRIALPLLPQGAQVEWVQQALLFMLLGNILIMGFVTIAQRSLDQVLGNSSVMHMGYIFLGIAAGTEIALQGAVLLMFAHGISIALLFALAGRMRNQLGTLELSKLGGLASHAPIFTLLFAFGAFASLGLPGLANFAGEVMVFLGAFGSNGSTEFGPMQWAVVVALWGVVMSAVYMLRAFRDIFQGTANAGLFMNDPVLSQRIPLILLAAALLIVGCCPWLLLDLLKSLSAAKVAAM